MALVSFITVFLLIIATAVVAYFQVKKPFTLSMFTTGRIQFELYSQTQNEKLLLIPGEEKELHWKMVHTGTTPFYSKGKFTVIFKNPHLNDSTLQVKSVEIKTNGSEWKKVRIKDRTFHLAASDDIEEYFIIKPQQKVEFRANIELLRSTQDEYQNESGEVQIDMVAKQIHAQAPWPEL